VHCAWHAHTCAVQLCVWACHMPATCLPCRHLPYAHQDLAYFMQARDICRRKHKVSVAELGRRQRAQCMEQCYLHGPAHDHPHLRCVQNAPGGTYVKEYLATYRYGHIVSCWLELSNAGLNVLMHHVSKDSAANYTGWLNEVKNALGEQVGRVHLHHASTVLAIR
jgi:hypothetical protein